MMARFRTRTGTGTGTRSGTRRARSGRARRARRARIVFVLRHCKAKEAKREDYRILHGRSSRYEFLKAWEESEDEIG